MERKSKVKIKIKNELNNSIVENLYEQYNKKMDKCIKDYTFYLKSMKDKIDMAKNILKHKDVIWCPSHDIELQNLKLNTWFSIKESLPQDVNFKQNKYVVEDKENVKYKCKRITLDLTNRQKNIIDKWLNAYLDMYNIALKYIKDNIETNKNLLNFMNLRKILKNDRDILVENSGTEIKILNKKNKVTGIKMINKIKVHDMDYAIKLACQNYKSALSNLRKGYIKKFRIRYWRKNKTNKIMDLEEPNFNYNTIRKDILGNVKGYYNGKRFDFNTIDCDCRLQRVDEMYYLFAPELLVLNKMDSKNKDEQITVDPGIRKFGTGITENKVVKIGDECDKIIRNYLLRKDKIMSNENISKEIKKKNELMINRKIKNLVNELHWKSIDYLTKNYKTILIGDMSTKSIVSKKGNLNKMSKRIALHLNFYKFHQKLKYKCNINNAEYGKIKEWMTSKMCSNCGSIKENLGSSEIYECEECKVTMDRDVNGARNIHIKAIK